ncbi:MAG: hypothetical protein NTX57_16550 [Armatimonadetes bacterium]|nr:hypothetical protein [Armatimonadota bacterium]
MKLILDPSQHFQTLEGIGASLAWSGDPVGETWSEAAKTQLADLLFCPERGAGLSGVRFNIGAGGAWAEESPLDPWRHPKCFKRTAESAFDPSCHEGQQWFLRAAAERGASCRVAFANSPPLWLTQNGRATHDKSESQKALTTNLKPGAEPAFAAFLAEVVEHFERVGLPFTALSPVNEPQWAWEDATQEGCRFSNSDILALAHTLRLELDRRSLAIELDLPEAADLRFLIDGQAEALAVVCEGKLCGHGYWSYDPPEESRRIREAVRRAIAQHVPGGRFWQSEVCVMEPGRDLGMELSLRVARMMHQDFVHADASAWFWWLALSPYDYKDGLIYLGDNEAISPSKTLWALGNFARFLRPGWRRIFVTPTEADGLYVSAWCDPAGEQLALVAINTTDQERTLELSESYALTPHITDGSRDLVPGEELAPGERLLAEPYSITTWTPSR